MGMGTGPAGPLLLPWAPSPGAQSGWLLYRLTVSTAPLDQRFSGQRHSSPPFPKEQYRWD